MAEKKEVAIGITVVNGDEETELEYHLKEELAAHFILGGAITVDLGIEPRDVVACAYKSGERSNHMNCKERSQCDSYRPVQVCQKIHQQGCYQELC